MMSFARAATAVSLLFVLGVAGAAPITFSYNGACVDGPQKEGERIFDCRNIGLENGDSISGRIEVADSALDDLTLTGAEIRNAGAFNFDFGLVNLNSDDSFMSGFLQLDASFNIVGGFFNIQEIWTAANTLSFADNGAGLWGVRVGLFGARFAGGFGRYTTDLAVPEPGTLALLGIGLIGFGAVRRRRVD